MRDRVLKPSHRFEGEKVKCNCSLTKRVTFMMLNTMKRFIKALRVDSNIVPIIVKRGTFSA